MNLYVLLGVGLVFLAGVLASRSERWKRRLVCPTTGTTEDVDVVHRWGDADRPVRVAKCSLFPNAKRVGCSEDCIKKEYLREG